MPELIEQLSPAQEARLPEFRDKWAAIALSTQPADRARAETAIAAMYRRAGFAAPHVIWLPCPLSAAVSAVVYASLFEEGTTGDASQTERVESKVARAVRSAADSVLVHTGGFGPAMAGRWEADLIASRGSFTDHPELQRWVRFGLNVTDDIAFRESLKAAVSDAVRSALGSARRASRGWEVDRKIDHTLRSSMSEKIRRAVSPALCLRMGMSSSLDIQMGNAVDCGALGAVDFLGEAENPHVRQAGQAHTASAHQIFECAQADFYQTVFGIPIERDHLDLREASGRCWMLDEVCFASERAREIHLDERQRLYCSHGQSVRYATGWGFWHWHDVRMPRHAIEHPERMTVATINRETNVEVRRAMIEIYGHTRYLVHSGAALIHEDARGKLWRRQQGGLEPILIVEVRNSTPEPDGSIKNYFLRVPPDMRSASQAVAWTFGMTVHTYRPRIET